MWLFLKQTNQRRYNINKQLLHGSELSERYVPRLSWPLIRLSLAQPKPWIVIMHTHLPHPAPMPCCCFIYLGIKLLLFCLLIFYLSGGLVAECNYGFYKEFETLITKTERWWKPGVIHFIWWGNIIVKNGFSTSISRNVKWLPKVTFCWTSFKRKDCHT